MGTSRWKPLPPDLPLPARELAERMRARLDDDGLSLRQLATSDDVHYSVITLQRYFSGQALPPRQLIEVISRRCGGDSTQLHVLYERASAVDPHEIPDDAENNGETRLAEPEPPQPMSASSAGSRRWLVVAAVAALLGGGATFGITALLNDDTPTPRPASHELVVNGGFDNLNDEPEDNDGFAKWWTLRADVTPQGGLPQIMVPGGTQHHWDVLFGQSGITITTGREYTLHFTAWTTKAARIAVRVQVEKPPYREVFQKIVTLDPAQKRFTYPFTAGFSTGKGQVLFQLGGDQQDYTIYLDNVSLVEHRHQ